MNLPDDKQLVRESSGHIEQPNNISKMGLHAKLAWIALFFCLGLIALAHCVPVEVIYTGEGCDCPSKLDYTVNVPSVPKSKKYPYIPSEYGYKVDVPIARPAKAKVTYSFDITVEEPRTPKPAKPSTLNLFAKVDRVAVKKGDCEDSYTAPSAPSACRCGQCGITKPLYRYVSNNMPSQPPCNCRRPNCKCNLCRAASTPYSPNAIFMGPFLSDMAAMTLETGSGGGDGDDENVESGSGGAEVGAVNIRRKRDLHRTLFRPRKMTRERPGRFVKLYHKNLSDTPHRVFDFDGLAHKQHQQQTPKKTKRKAKRTHYKSQRARLVKRDIKGEYELLEKEREQMDLTLPEIIQFMPETLQPNFKRGQCYFGCGSQRPTNQPKSTQSNTGTLPSSSSSDPSSTEFTVSNKEVNENTAATITYSDTNNGNGKITDMNMDMTTDEDANANTETDNTRFPQPQKVTIIEENSHKETKDSTSQNDIGSTYTKRQAANYYSGRSASCAESANPSYSKCLPALLKKRAYRANLPPAPTFSTNPNYKPQQLTYSTKSAHSAAQPTAQLAENAPTSPYFYDHMGHKYLEINGHMRDLTSSLSVPDPLDRHATPLRYDGDLESPTPTYTSYLQDTAPTVGAQNYPVQHITNEQLDKIIADIVYSHPEFIHSSSHFSGALVDPEPWQEQETITFLKKLIEGRLSLWFGKEDEHDHGIPQLHDLQPPLY